MFFISKNVFFLNRFHACYWLKKNQNNIPKEVETKLVVQSTLWAVIENMFFWCLGLLTNNHRDLLLGSF